MAAVEQVVAPSDKPVLIVDDMASVRWLLTELLTRAGFRTIAAADGQEACRLLTDGVAPCAILLDVRMPGMDGWEFLRTAAPAAPVILMSGMGADHLPRLPPGVVAFLEKPLSLALVLDALRTARADRSARPDRAEFHAGESAERLVAALAPTAARDSTSSCRGTCPPRRGPGPRERQDRPRSRRADEGRARTPAATTPPDCRHRGEAIEHAATEASLSLWLGSLVPAVSFSAISLWFTATQPGGPP